MNFLLRDSFPLSRSTRFALWPASIFSDNWLLLILPILLTAAFQRLLQNINSYWIKPFISDPLRILTSPKFHISVIICISYLILIAIIRVKKIGWDLTPSSGDVVGCILNRYCRGLSVGLSPCSTSCNWWNRGRWLQSLFLDLSDCPILSRVLIVFIWWLVSVGHLLSVSSVGSLVIALFRITWKFFRICIWYILWLSLIGGSTFHWNKSHGFALGPTTNFSCS